MSPVLANCRVLVFAWIPSVVSLAPGDRKIVPGRLPSPITYSCVVEFPISARSLGSISLLYDRGKFRQEALDPSTGKRTRLTIYNRDGQGLSYYYWRMKPLSAGVDVDGLRYRLLRDHTAEFFKIYTYPADAIIINHEPRPTGWLESFALPWDPKLYEKAGESTVDGRKCVVYAPRGAERNSRAWLHVWRGYILQRSAPDGTLQFRVRDLKFVPRIDPRKFELLPGTIVKVPVKLKVKLPAHVKRIEYPGYGIERSGGGTRVR